MGCVRATSELERQVAVLETENSSLKKQVGVLEQESASLRSWAYSGILCAVLLGVLTVAGAVNMIWLFKERDRIQAEYAEVLRQFANARQEAPGQAYCRVAKSRAEARERQRQGEAIT
jgi:hypothetical protein